jgi:geranylgeranyl diphosphate synthase type 3/geranylgeranyl diphosphate synthase type I
MPEFLNYYGKLFKDSMIMERIIPRQVDNASLEETFPYLFTEHYKSEFPKADVAAVNKGLLEPMYDLMDRGGKRWRPCLGLAFAECFGRDAKKFEDDIYYACGLTEIVHNGSLMADDIEDRSQLRRGLPCTYLKYGLDYAVNASTLMYYIPIA